MWLPSELLQRRTDIAAADKTHRSCQRPSLHSTKRMVSYAYLKCTKNNYQSDEFGNLVSPPNLLWAVGPALVTKVFGGGLRATQVDAAKEATVGAPSKHPAQVLAAFQ